MIFNKNLRYPLNLQYFATNEGGSGTEGNPNQNVENSGSNEWEKKYNELKASFDKASSQLADYKKKENANKTEEEKRNEFMKEQEAKIATLQRQVDEANFKSTLSSNGKLTQEQVGKIVEGYYNEDKNVLMKTIVSVIDELDKKLRKEITQELNSQTHIPGKGNGNSETEAGAYGKKLAEATFGKGNESYKKAREKFGL